VTHLSIKLTLVAYLPNKTLQRRIRVVDDTFTNEREFKKLTWIALIVQQKTIGRPN